MCSGILNGEAAMMPVALILEVDMRCALWMRVLCAVMLIAGVSACDDEAGSAGIQPQFDTAISTDLGSDTGLADTGSDTGGGLPCGSDLVCTDPGEICVYEVDREAPSIDTVCAQPIGPNGDGDGCTSDEDCERGLCINGTCVAPCEGDNDCPSPLVCGTESVIIDGSTITVPACVPEPCESRVDCDGTQTCVIDRSGSALDLSCADPVGGGNLGDSCTDDADCGANLCLDGGCVEPCQRNNDCSTDGSVVCSLTDVTLGGGGLASLPLCVPAPPESCTADAQCTDAAERCVANKSATDLTFTCDAPNTGGGENGDPCSTDAECAQNLCVDGVCQGPCQVDGDCGNALFDCDLVTVDLGGGASDDANLCVPPTFCDEADDCTTDQVCSVSRDLRPDTSTPTLTLTCAPDNVRSETGTRCTDDADCKTNLCFTGRFTNYCSEPCVDTTDCPTGFSCSTEDLLASDNSTSVPTGICVENDPPACDEQSDCASLAGTTCAVVETADGSSLESVCYAFPGSNNTVPCSADNECRSRVCLGGFCANLCDGNDLLSCAAGQLCRNDQGYSRGGASGTFDLCETLPDELCGGTPDCTDADGASARVCGGLGSSNTGPGLETSCVFPNAGGDPFGAACTNGSSCRDNVCLNASGECSAYCTEDDHCSGYQQGSETVLCTGYQFNIGPTWIGHCTYGCLDDDDCTGLGTNAKVCTTASFQTSAGPWDLNTVCEEPAGPGDLGTLCSSGSECISGLCLTTYNGNACSSSSDCTDPQYPNCEQRAGAGMECAISGCTRLCDSTDDSTPNADCQGSASATNYSVCTNSITLGLPDNQVRNISACGR